METPFQRKSFIKKRTKWNIPVRLKKDHKQYKVSDEEQHRKISSHSIIRKGSYFITLMSETKFIKHGAKRIDPHCYFKQMEYDGTNVGETIALLGIPLFHVDYFYSYNESNNDYIQSLMKSNDLQYIEDIDKLNFKLPLNNI